MNKITKIDSIDLAYYLLSKLGPMNQLKLQKLIYYIEAWHLAILETSIIDDEFEAWVHGPVSRKIWINFKDKSLIYDDINEDTDKINEVSKDIESKISEDQLELIKDVLDEYGNDSAYELERQTHSEAPWKLARKGLAVNEVCNSIIDKEIMKEYYQKRLDAQEEATEE